MHLYHQWALWLMNVLSLPNLLYCYIFGALAGIVVAVFVAFATTRDILNNWRGIFVVPIGVICGILLWPIIIPVFILMMLVVFGFFIFILASSVVPHSQNDDQADCSG